MGLGDRRRANRCTFLKIYNNRIIQEWKEGDLAPTEASTKEVFTRKTEKNTYNYIEWDYIEANIIALQLIEGTGVYGDQLSISMEDEGGLSYKMDTYLTGSHGTEIIRRLPNIDLSKPVWFETWSMSPEVWKEKNGGTISKPRVGMMMKQDDKNTKHFYTKDTGYPDLEKKKKGKKEVWDGSKREEFIYEKVEEQIEKVKSFHSKKSLF